MSEKKTIMVVDDSDVDRTILTSMLSDEFEIVEKNSGFAAINHFSNDLGNPDALLLDISMPAVDGFAVLQFMRESGIRSVPVFLVTAEATRDNVAKAMQYNVAEFIRKPFDKDYIIERIKLQLGIMGKHELTSKDLRETNRYIAELGTVYKRYLRNFGGDHTHCQRVSDLVAILLREHSRSFPKQALDDARIDIISKAAYFYDIGNMVVPPETVKTQAPSKAYVDSYTQHTILGAKLVHLNISAHCGYFIDVCSDICMHHHERYDGTGFPHRIIGDHNSIYSQMCRLADRFDRLFFPYETHSGSHFMFVMHEMEKDEGNVGRDIFSTLEYARDGILRYYQENDKEK